MSPPFPPKKKIINLRNNLIYRIPVARTSSYFDILIPSQKITKYSQLRNNSYNLNANINSYDLIDSPICQKWKTPITIFYIVYLLYCF